MNLVLLRFMWQIRENKALLSNFMIGITNMNVIYQVNNNQYVDFAQNQIFKYVVCHSEMIHFENYIINTSSVECLIVYHNQMTYQPWKMCNGET